MPIAEPVRNESKSAHLCQKPTRSLNGNVMAMRRRCGMQCHRPMQASVTPQRPCVEDIDAVEQIAASVVTLPLVRSVEWRICATFSSKPDIVDGREPVTRRSDASSLRD